MYRVSPLIDGRFESAVYTLPGDALAFAGAWRDSRVFAELSPGDLIPRDGCAIVLEHVGGEMFVGSTVGTSCESSLAGAAYATSEVTIFADRLVSWDRGFDAEGHQVWGAEKGAYVFVRKPQ